MPTLAQIADCLAVTYDQLLTRNDPSLERSLDALFEAVAGLDALCDGIPSPGVRAMLRPFSPECRGLVPRPRAAASPVMDDNVFDDPRARVRKQRYDALVSRLLPEVRRLNPMWSDEEVLESTESMAELRLLDEEIG